MWYILNYVPGPGKRRSQLPQLIDHFNESHPDNDSGNLELFAPTFINLATEEGQVTRRERPLLYHYIFVKGSYNTVKDLCMSHEGFSFVINRSGVSRHLTVSDETLEQFRIIANYHSGKLPCYPLEGINLEEGDKVQIVSGACAGLTGTYISRKGGKHGNVLISVEGTMAAIVYDVKADYVRVLEFARDSRRLYDQLDSFTGRLLPCLDGSADRRDLRLLSAAGVFSQRLEIVKVPNPKIEAKLAILLYAAFRLLADEKKATKALERYKSLEKHVTNPSTRTLYERIIGFF